MRIITEKRLREFGSQRADARTSLESWRRTAEAAYWRSLQDVRATYPTADAAGCLTVFNIGGNKYRLIAAIDYKRGKIFIRSVLTHGEYDKDRWKNDPWFKHAPFLR